MLVTIALAALGAAKILDAADEPDGCCCWHRAGRAPPWCDPTWRCWCSWPCWWPTSSGGATPAASPAPSAWAGSPRPWGSWCCWSAGPCWRPPPPTSSRSTDLSTTSLSSALSTTQAKTNQGNSAYHAVNPNSPIGYPDGRVHRPVPARCPARCAPPRAWWPRPRRSPCSCWSIAGWRRLVGALRLRSEAYVTFSLAYLAMFGYAFSAIANFGILTRERVQVLPFLFVPLCLPKWYRQRRAGPRDARWVGRRA